MNNRLIIQNLYKVIFIIITLITLIIFHYICIDISYWSVFEKRNSSSTNL